MMDIQRKIRILLQKLITFPDMTTLEILDSNRELARIPLKTGSVTAGRLRTNTVALENAGVSRQHLRIETDSTGTWHVLEDLGSLNGTYVNGQKVGVCLLQAGDEIQLGQFKIRVLSE
jgi:pSer/pThr/pTyr-binding forkhead associated (FHA) protein